MTLTEIREKAAEFGTVIRETQESNPDILDVRFSEWREFCRRKINTPGEQFAASRSFYKARYKESLRG